MPKATTAKRGHKDGKVRRHKKDPNAPKRSRSAYMWFASDKREEVCIQNPGISFGQIGRLLGLKWKALSEKDRLPYKNKAQKDKERYEAEKAKYNADLA